VAAILLALEGAGNRRILFEWLAPPHEIFYLEEGLASDRPVDLIIVDSPALDRFGQAIEDRVSTAQTLLPVLLVVPRHRPGIHIVPRHRPGIALPQRWRQANELITAPITKDELEVRIAGLLTLREREKHLYEARELLRMATELAQLGFWEWDTRTDQVHFPLEWSKQLGYAEALPNQLEEWVLRLHPDEREQVLAKLDRLRTAPSSEFEIEFRLRHRDGSYRWFQSKVALIPEQGSANRRLVISQLDVSAQKAAQEHIRKISQYDALTDLPNRALLYEFGEHLLAGARRSGTKLAILFFDLDRFKPINDTYGHHVGDQVLQQVARRISQSVRGEDLVGRLGGDEFLAVLTRIRKCEDAARVAHHALKLLGQPYHVEGLEIDCTPCIGISLFPQDGESIPSLIKHADDAMYYAKEAGGNNYQFFTKALNQKAQAAAVLENRMRDGIERDEFRLFYQPVIDTVSAAVVGVEALIRWPQAGQTDLGAAMFIPVAESSGLIHGLGEWVFDEACRQHRQWLEAGLPPITVAVNVSAAQFRAKDFPQRLAHAINDACIAPAYLSLEITENTLMTNMDESVRVLGELRGLGIKVALDAFGTGSSSLSQLSRLPLDKIKVDRSFIHHLDDDDASCALVEAIIALGRTLDLQIVAEGVENEEMLQFVKRRHCQQAQGFYLCRPLPADEFAHWYRREILATSQPCQR